MRRVMVLIVLTACGSDGHSQAPTDGSNPTDGSGSSTTCPRTQGPDGARTIVVSRPYDTAGNKASLYEVISLSATGTLTRPTKTFSMGRDSFGSIEFTPDGKIGLVAQNEDGTVGVFSLASDGTPTVIDPGFGHGMFYAERVIMDPSGTFAYVLDGDTTNNGGGIYKLNIGCDGTPTFGGLLAAANTPRRMVTDGTRAFLASTKILDSVDGADVEMLTSTPTVTASSDGFGDDEAIAGGFALTADKHTLLLGDVNSVSGPGSRVAVITVGDTTLTKAPTLTPIADPESIETSPFGNVALVTTADGDAIHILDTTNGAWRIRGLLPYTSGNPMQPGDTAQIHRGALNGHVFISELSSIRQVVFHDDGSVVDIGALQFGDGIDQIIGAIGVTP